MTFSIRAAAAAAGILGTLTLPLAAPAATTSSAGPQLYSLATQLTDRYHAGAYVGRLALTIYPDGIVQGTYRPDEGGFSTVTGGVNGNEILARHRHDPAAPRDGYVRARRAQDGGRDPRPRRLRVRLGGLRRSGESRPVTP